jgi:protein-disulfide isomerase-like protein with CxxC motif
VALVVLVGLALSGLACGGTKLASMTEDDKHKLFQAVGMSGDPDLILEASKKMGLVDSNNQPTPAMEPFIKAHSGWAKNNEQFVKEHLTKEKAREYVKNNMP